MPKQVARLLAALHRKGETVAEVAGAAAAMRQRMTPIRSARPDLIDTCGTGGDGSKTFNISTAAALVTAAAGVPVAKHGNRGITSRSGSADVLGRPGREYRGRRGLRRGLPGRTGHLFLLRPALAHGDEARGCRSASNWARRRSSTSLGRW